MDQRSAPMLDQRSVSSSTILNPYAAEHIKYYLPHRDYNNIRLVSSNFSALPTKEDKLYRIPKYRRLYDELQTALINNDLPVFKDLIEYIGPDIHVHEDIYARVAARAGHLEILRYLVSIGANTNTSGEIDFTVTVGVDEYDDEYDDDYEDYGNYIQITPRRTTAGRGSDILHGCKFPQTAFLWAVKNGRYNILDYLLSDHIEEDGGQKADIHEYNDIAIYIAAEGNNVDMINYLISHGVDPILNLDI